MLQSSWKNWINSETAEPYFQAIFDKIDSDTQQGINVYPPRPLIFESLMLTPLDETKVVILGQDPYHGPDQAHGLAFSVPEHIRLPPSLRNILKELSSDLNISLPHGDLTHWAQQGVLLLNTSLSVQHKSPGSHAKIGWQTFTDKVIATISTQRPHVVFILWGGHAQSKRTLIDQDHLIISSAHPSPLSAHRGFFGSKPFSTTNAWLESKGIRPIQWG